MVSNLALFCLATYFATFKKIGLFFLNHLVTLPLTYSPFLSKFEAKMIIGQRQSNESLPLSETI
jgi:hypothetical protein